jgi:probable F420-dependent oxidoreductase
MTDPMPVKPDLGRFGVWVREPMLPEQAVEVERLGYGAVWVGGSPAAELSFVEPILEKTSTLQVATGVVTTWIAAPEVVAESFHRIEAAYPGRFLLGVGVGHPEALAQYRNPIDALNAYLDKLDEYGVPVNRRVIAALGPRVLSLSAQHSAGAHPYLTTPEHSARARAVMGPRAFLAPEHKALLVTDAAQAREVGRQNLEMYLGLRNYLNNWKRLGFTDEDLILPISDRLVDAMIAYGTADVIASRLSQHLDAGADHVAIRVLGAPDQLLPTLAALAAPLGLRQSAVEAP